MDNVSITGMIDSNFKIKNDFFIIKNIHYTPNSNPEDICVNLGGNLEIENSKFFGGISCIYRLMKFYGFNKYNISINNSYFSGEYACAILFIDTTNKADIKNSVFEKVFSNNSEGGGIGILNSSAYVYNCTFEDILVKLNGGAISLYNVYDFVAEKINNYNITSLSTGSFAAVTTTIDEPTKALFKNIYQKKTGYRNDILYGALIFGLNNKANVIVDDYIAEDLINTFTSGSLILLTENVQLSIYNMKIKNAIGNGNSGQFINVYKSTGIKINLYNIELEKFYQYNEQQNSILFWYNENVSSTIENVSLKNIRGKNSRMFYMTSYCNIYMKNITIDNFFSETPHELFSCLADTKDTISLNIDNLTLNNIQFLGSIFFIKNGIVKMTNSKFIDIHTCNEDNTCKNNLDTDEHILQNEIAVLYNDSKLYISYSHFEHIVGKKGFSMSESSYIEFNNNTMNNCYYNNGLITIDSSQYNGGEYSFENSTFTNIKSESGTIINIKNIKYISGHINVLDCEFKNITASIGHITYCFDKNSEPNISNINEFKKSKGFIATNPTSIKINNDSLNEISLFSGETIPEGIEWNIYDDYNNLISQLSDISNIKLDELILFTLEPSDEYNIEFNGNTQSYCFGSSCVVPPIRVVGNPGKYYITLKIINYGPFNEFENNYLDIPLEIKNCNSSYINQSIHSSRIKSCYLPKCNPGCNTGKCINNDICNCTNTLFTGKHCNEHYKMERMNIVDYLIRIISILLFIIVIILTVLTWKYKNFPLIKGGGVDFLILILIGSVYYLTYIFLLTFERNLSRCYSIFLFNNIGFSLVYGSTFVKTLRIYEIFLIANKQKFYITKKIMLSIIFFLVVINLLLMCIWNINNSIESKPELTNTFKEYQACYYPKSYILIENLNITILIFSSYLSYSTRKVEKKFNENLAIPIYSFVITSVIKEIVNYQNVLLWVKDLFNTSTTIVNITLILYYLYIIKFYNIYIS